MNAHTLMCPLTNEYIKAGTLYLVTIHISIHVYFPYTYMHTHTYLCNFTHAHTYLFTPYTHAHTFKYLYTHMHKHTNIYSYVPPHNMCVYSSTYTQIFNKKDSRIHQKHYLS